MKEKRYAGLRYILIFGILAGENMASSRSEDLYRLMLEKGYPEPFCKEVAYKNLNTDYTATRMLGYLYRVSDPKLEMVVDEMLAILSDRDELVKKHEAEHAQAVISEIYRNGLTERDD